MVGMGDTGDRKRSKYRRPVRDQSPPPDYSIQNRYTIVPGAAVELGCYRAGIQTAPRWAQISAAVFVIAVVCLLDGGPPIAIGRSRSTPNS